MLLTIAGIVLSFGAAIVAYISCEAAQRFQLADSAKLFALTFLLVTFGAQDGVSKLLSAVLCHAACCPHWWMPYLESSQLCMRSISLAIQVLHLGLVHKCHEMACQ